MADRVSPDQVADVRRGLDEPRDPVVRAQMESPYMESHRSIGV